MILHVPSSGELTTPAEIWHAWPMQPVVGFTIATAAVLYWRGVVLTWRAAGSGRGVRRPRAIAFAGAMIALGVALLSPLDPLGETLFSAHMVQHLVLMTVAAPLVAYSMPLPTMLRALPRDMGKRLARAWVRAATVRSTVRALASPGVSWVPQTAALWLWHTTSLYEAALRHPLTHALEHGSFLATALLFWWGILNVTRRPYRSGILKAIAALFITTLQSGVLGALVAMSSHPWYPLHARGAAAWGMSALEDQQLAGLIMWVPGGMFYVVAALYLMSLVLRATTGPQLAFGVTHEGAPWRNP